MYIFLIIILLLIAILVLAFALILIIPVALSFEFNSEKNKLLLSMVWVHLFLKATVSVHDLKPIISIYVFNKKVYSHVLKTGKNRRSMKYLKALKLEDSYLRAFYGMQNPLTVGLVHGVVGCILPFLDIEFVEEYPDFMPLKEYVIVEAGANLSIWSSVMNYFRISKKKRRDEYGYA